MDFFIASYLKYLLIMELRFDVILYPKLGTKISDADHMKSSRGPHDLHPCFICMQTSYSFD